MFRLAAITLACVLIPFVKAVAQSDSPGVRLRGIAFDSLRGRPLSDAFVAVVGGGRTATTDARGRFEFDGVTPGSYLITLQHATLDTLGFPGLSSRVRVTDGRDDVRISTPSFSTIWRTVCGDAPAPADSGIVYGSVRHAMTGVPMGTAIITIAWHDSIVSLRGAASDLVFREREALRNQPRRVFVNPKTESERRMPADRDDARATESNQRNEGSRYQRVDWSRGARTDSTGTYAMCGVPITGHDIRVHAWADAATTDSIGIRMDPRVVRRDLRVGLPAPGPEGRGTVVGELTNHAGAPFPHARVMVAGATEGRSDDSGRFVIRNVPAGTREVEVRFLGMQPAHARVDVVAGDTARVALSVNRIPTLPGMTARASTIGRVMAAEFTLRRKAGLGYAIDSTTIARYPSVANVLSDVPGLQSSLRGASLTAQVPDGRGGTCTPTVWLDGLEAGFGNLLDLTTKELVALEVYIRPITVPAAYVQPGGETKCGAILAWTSYLFRNR